MEALLACDMAGEVDEAVEMIEGLVEAESERRR